MAKFEIDAAKLNTLSKAAYAGEKSFADEVEALKAVAVGGAIPKPYADAYKTAVVCAALGLTRTKANLAEAAKPEHKDLRAMAANRLSRRVKAAGIKAANASGRKRGAKVSTGTPAPTAPAPQTIVGRTIVKGGKKVQAEAAKATFGGMSVPQLSTTEQLDDMLSGMIAFVRATMTANPDAVDDTNRAAAMQLTAAVENLRRTRAEQEEPNH
jgi:hypothetical protein